MTEQEQRYFWYRYDYYLSLGLRKGQSLMNALWDVSPDAHAFVHVNRELDCFYNDDKIPAFCQAVGIEEPE